MCIKKELNNANVNTNTNTNTNTSATLENKDITATIQANMSNIPDRIVICPHCGSGIVVRYGVTQSGRQRYLCNKCKKTFIGQTNTVFSKSKLDVRVWLRAEECLRKGMSLRKMSKELGVSLKTCQSLKKKIMQIS